MNYKIHKEIGAGSFGIVSLASNEDGLDVAIKTFKDPRIPGVDKSDLVRRFEREVRLQSSIDHRNVIRIIDHNLDDDPPWFVMELAECTLKDMMDNGTCDNDTKKRALFDILAGLEAIHERGYRHRDLKPANVLHIKRSDGDAFAISDFGLGAPRDGETSTLTATGVQGGTEMYAAPELAKSFRRATPASDVYSFGAILHDFFVGKRRTPYAKQYGSGQVGAVIEKCTETVPKKRYATIAELRSDLFAALEGLKEDILPSEDQKVIDILAKENISSQDWDEVFIRIDELENDREFSRNIILAFDQRHVELLLMEHPELLSAYVFHLLEYVIETEGALSFDFCDVLADQILIPYDAVDVEGRAALALALLILGTRHNRWYVERRFVSLVGPDADTVMVERLISEANARGMKLEKYVSHLEVSIGTNSSSLHELLRKFF